MFVKMCGYFDTIWIYHKILNSHNYITKIFIFYNIKNVDIMSGFTYFPCKIDIHLVMLLSEITVLFWSFFWSPWRRDRMNSGIVTESLSWCLLISQNSTNSLNEYLIKICTHLSNSAVIPDFIELVKPSFGKISLSLIYSVLKSFNLSDVYEVIW